MTRNYGISVYVPPPPHASRWRKGARLVAGMVALAAGIAALFTLAHIIHALFGDT